MDHLSKTARIMFYSCLTLLVDSCDDKLKNIDSWGEIIMKDSCEIGARRGWIVNLDLSLTKTPNGNDIIPVKTDTINGVVYHNLVRIFAKIRSEDTASITTGNKFNFKIDPTNALCDQSGDDFSNYVASDEYSHMK